MFCDRCGTQLRDRQHLCHSCGKSFGTEPVARGPRSRVADNVRILGILWIVYSAAHLVPGAFLHFMPTRWPWFFHWNWDAEEIFFVCLIGVAVGWGLLERRHWARIRAIVFGALALLNIPFGTALGVYTLYVLVPEESEREYNQLAGAG